MKTTLSNLKSVKTLTRDELKAINGGASFCGWPGEAPCCEYLEDENGNPTTRCRLRAICVGGAQIYCP